LRQALKGLKHAAQQAAEKAVKALYQKLRLEVWGHSISRMLSSLPKEYKPPQEFVEKAKELDGHYILARYPNLHPEGAPLDYYTEEDAKRAIEYAEKIVEFCRSKGF